MPEYFKAEKLELVRSGEAFFNLLKRLIEDSRQIIHLQTYIFDDDRTGRVVLAALCRAARRGIKVYLLIDAFGSPNFSKKFQRLCQTAGINFRFYAPIFSPENIFMGRRLHHKIVCVDGIKALVGGINIADKYHGDLNAVPWLDFALYTEAKDNRVLAKICESFYFQRISNERQPVKLAVHENTLSLCYRCNDWIMGENEIHRSYQEQLRIATTDIIIVASYFLPGRRFRNLMKKAVQRGVRVRLIIAGQSDTFTVRFAENYLYDYYLRNKIQVFEWKTSVMHGKAMITDKSWCTIGSYNLNFLSHFASIELNAESRDPLLISSFTAELEGIADTCGAPILPEIQKKKTGLLRRFLFWLSYSIFRILRSILAGISKRRKRQFH